MPNTIFSVNELGLVLNLGFISVVSFNTVPSVGMWGMTWVRLFLPGGWVLEKCHGGR